MWPTHRHTEPSFSVSIRQRPLNRKKSSDFLETKQELFLIRLCDVVFCKLSVSKNSRIFWPYPLYLLNGRQPRASISWIPRLNVSRFRQGNTHVGKYVSVVFRVKPASFFVFPINTTSLVTCNGRIHVESPYKTDYITNKENVHYILDNEGSGHYYHLIEGCTPQVDA